MEKLNRRQDDGDDCEYGEDCKKTGSITSTSPTPASSTIPGTATPATTSEASSNDYDDECDDDDCKTSSRSSSTLSSKSSTVSSASSITTTASTTASPTILTTSRPSSTIFSASSQVTLNSATAAPALLQSSVAPSAAAEGISSAQIPSVPSSTPANATNKTLIVFGSVGIVAIVVMLVGAFLALRFERRKVRAIRDDFEIIEGSSGNTDGGFRSIRSTISSSIYAWRTANPLTSNSPSDSSPPPLPQAQGWQPEPEMTTVKQHVVEDVRDVEGHSPFTDPPQNDTYGYHGLPEDHVDMPRTPQKSFFPDGEDDGENEQSRRRLVALSVDAGVPGRVKDVKAGPKTGA